MKCRECGRESGVPISQIGKDSACPECGTRFVSSLEASWAKGQILKARKRFAAEVLHSLVWLVVPLTVVVAYFYAGLTSGVSRAQTIAAFATLATCVALTIGPALAKRCGRQPETRPARPGAGKAGAMRSNPQVHGGRSSAAGSERRNVSSDAGRVVVCLRTLREWLRGPYYATEEQAMAVGEVGRAAPEKLSTSLMSWLSDPREGVSMFATHRLVTIAEHSPRLRGKIRAALRNCRSYNRLPEGYRKILEKDMGGG